MDDTILKVNNLKVYFVTEGKESHAVDGVDFEVKKGEILGIVGESGCGKSVTSLSIMRLVKCPPGKIVDGEILLEGKDILKYSDKEMRDIKGKEVSMIFQEPMTSLNPAYTIGNQLVETLLSHEKITRREAKEIVLDMLKKVMISRPEQIMKSFPHELSGGMRQRIMIAMALLCKPKLLIADEPTTALDVTIQAQILELLKKLQEETQTAIMLITHDLGVIAEVAQHVVVMYAGKIVEDASVGEIFDHPMHPYTVGLQNSTPKIEYQGEKLETIEGYVPNMTKEVKGCAFKTRCPYAMKICGEQVPELKEVSPGHKVRCFHCEP